MYSIENIVPDFQRQINPNSIIASDLNIQFLKVEGSSDQKLDRDI